MKKPPEGGFKLHIRRLLGFFREKFFDCLCGVFACAHGGYNGGGARDGVAACIDCAAGGQTVFVNYDSAARIDGKSFRRVFNERVRGSADRNNNCIDFQNELGIR